GAPASRRGAPHAGVRAPDAAPGSRQAGLQARGRADAVPRLGRPPAAEPGAARPRGGARRVGARGPGRARDPRLRGVRALRLPGRLPRALLREAPLPLRAARAGRALHVPRAGAGSRGARRGSRAALPRRGGRGLTGGVTELNGTRRESAVAAILEKALDGERIDDGEALALLESRDLVAVGRTANAMRSRRTDPSRVTFIVDRNINY